MSLEDRELRLLDIASGQAGYFTGKQALSAGYSYQLQSYYALSGQWIRVHPGLYRLRLFPAQPREHLVVLTLLSRNREGEPQAFVSHDTALAIYDISDANPAHVHLTVPPGYRKPMPPEVALHHARLTDEDWVNREGYRITTPLRTILDIASSDTSWPHLEAAVRDALDAGLVRKKHLLAANGPERVMARLRSAVAAAEQGGISRLDTAHSPTSQWNTRANTTNPTALTMTGAAAVRQGATSGADVEVELKS